MLSMKPPQLCAESHVKNCVSKIVDSDLRNRVHKFAPTVGKASREYAIRGQSTKLYRMPRFKADDLSTKELQKLYTYCMINEKQPGRKVYDAIVLSAPKYLCPYCGSRPAVQVDHYLAKAVYAELATVPLNLVPCCEACNSIKKTHNPKTQAEQILHPYFDKIDVNWLIAAVAPQSHELALRFGVRPDAKVDPLTLARLRQHFTVLKLGFLFSVYAGSEATEISHDIQQLRNDAGGDGVRSHLIETAKGRFKANPNSWQAATYLALAESNDYCDGKLVV